MNINLKISYSDVVLTKQFLNLESKMSVILDAVKKELDEVRDLAQAIETSFDLLATEVRKLIALGDLAGADELLAEAQAVKAELRASIQANTDLAKAVDDANG